MISSLVYNGFGATTQVNYGNSRGMTLGYSVNRHQMTSMLVNNQNGTDTIINRTYNYGTAATNDGRIKPPKAFFTEYY